MDYGRAIPKRCFHCSSTGKHWSTECPRKDPDREMYPPSLFKCPGTLLPFVLGFVRKIIWNLGDTVFVWWNCSLFFFFLLPFLIENMFGLCSRILCSTKDPTFIYILVILVSQFGFPKRLVCYSFNLSHCGGIVFTFIFNQSSTFYDIILSSPIFTCYVCCLKQIGRHRRSKDNQRDLIGTHEMAHVWSSRDGFSFVLTIWYFGSFRLGVS